MVNLFFPFSVGRVSLELLLIIEFDRVLERFSPVREGSNGMIRWSRSSEFSGSNRDNRKPAG